jgi:hypothetical protein
MQADVERFLALLYTDGKVRQNFLANPAAVAMAHGLSVEESQAMAAISVQDLETASRGFERKRVLKARAKFSWWRMFRRLIGSH